MESLIISMYLGSKIFSGTVVFGKIIKLLKGKTGISIGKSIFFIKKIISSIIFLLISKL
tara:strand:- start:197 stop:373 length:177 start_codon:yes stop_codon:yes gene_type:complete